MRRTLGALLVTTLLVPLGVATSGAPPLVAAAEVDDATASLQGMTLEQRVGQVFLVGTPATGASAGVVQAVRDRHAGSVLLTGRSSRGVSATADVVRSLRALTTPAATAGVDLLVAVDQEGGAVQVLSGPGFSTIPSGLQQGSLDPAALRSRAAGWGRELGAAGVDLDLAPVLDTVPSPAAARTNPPIGGYDRQYGYSPEAVTRSGGAFAAGLADGGTAATAKHFPGLGRVTADPDTASGVTDTATVRGDPYLAPFAAAVRSGVPALMMSTAVYTRIDAGRPAAFSPTVIGALVRGDLGFDGVVVSDDLGVARQVAGYAPGDRALLFLAAGGDLVLTVDPAVLPVMYDAVLARARADRGFRARVEQAALRVLRLKQSRGLVPPGGLGAIGAKYTALGGEASALGEPVTPQYPTAGGGAEQDYVAGSILWSPQTGAYAVVGAVRDDYRGQGGPGGPLGYPVTDELAAVGGGRHNDFRGPAGDGSVYWTPSTGAHAVYGAVRERWSALGLAAGPLAYPLTDERAGGAGGRLNDFSGSGGGTIAWTPATGAHAVYGAVRATWDALGLTRGVLGYPTTDERDVGDGAGRYNDFSGPAGTGSVYWSPATGAHEVYGAVRQAWAGAGLTSGRLGYPTTGERPTPDGTGRYNDFAGGRITWSAADGSVAITYR